MKNVEFLIEFTLVGRQKRNSMRINETKSILNSFEFVTFSGA
ncbi:hypothetical protein AQAU111925_12890 [Aquirufa aurantiipilula]